MSATLWSNVVLQVSRYRLKNTQLDWCCLTFEKLLLLLLLPLKVLSAGAFRSLGRDMDRYNIDFEEMELTQPSELAAAHEDMTMPCMYICWLQLTECGLACHACVFASGAAYASVCRLAYILLARLTLCTLS